MNVDGSEWNEYKLQDNRMVRSRESSKYLITGNEQAEVRFFDSDIEEVSPING